MEFIQVDPTCPKKYNGGKTNVRKAAMRAFRRKERLERVRVFQARLAMESDAKNKSCRSPAPASAAMTLAQPESSGSVPDSPSIRSQDITWPPPVVLTNDGIPMSPAMDCYTLSTAPPSTTSFNLIPSIGHYDQADPTHAYLFNYFLSVMLPIMLPFDSKPGQKVVQSYRANSLLDDPLVLKIAVTHAALHLDKTYKQRATVLSAIHVRHTINLINERIKADSIDDKLIDTVAVLGTNTNITGDLTQSTIHENAIRELIRLRWGEETLTSGNIQTMLSWLDNTSAQLSRSLPRLACSFVEAKALDAAEPFTDELSAAYKKETLGIIDELHALTESKETIEAFPEIDISEKVTLNSTRSFLEKRILCCQYAFYTQPSLKFEDRFLESCSIASSIYTALTFRNFGLVSPVLRTLKQDLIDSIKKAELSFNSLHERPGAETPYAEMLFWVLILGGIMSLDDSEKTWFAQRIAMVLPWTLIRNWEEAEACLRRVLWTDKLYSTTCVSLWDEVEVLSGLRTPFVAADGFEVAGLMIY